MATQDIERLIADLQKGQNELARRDREHDEHITILLGQVVTLLPEVREIKTTLEQHTALLQEILSRLPGKE